MVCIMWIVVFKKCKLIIFGVFTSLISFSRYLYSTKNIVEAIWLEQCHGAHMWKIVECTVRRLHKFVLAMCIKLEPLFFKHSCTDSIFIYIMLFICDYYYYCIELGNSGKLYIYEPVITKKPCYVYLDVYYCQYYHRSYQCIKISSVQK